MLYPSINLLREKVDSKYTLVSMASKRARDIIDGKPVLTDSDIDKPISIATKEIAEDQITYRRNFSTEQEALEMEHRMKEEALDIAEKSEESGDGIIEYTAAEE
jgi:DNA-directed RNA polymerase subunit omega